MSDRIKGSALTMGGAACWGVSGCMGQYLFTREGMDSTWLVPIRLFLAGVILCGFFFIKDRKTLFDPWNVRKNPRNAIDLLVYGLAGVSCCQFTPDAAGLGVFDGRHHVFAHLPPVADRLCADGDGRVRHLHGRGAGQRAGAQSDYRNRLRPARAGVPRPDTLLLRRERCHDRLRPRIHVGDPRGQCRDAHVSGAERRAARLGQSPQGDVRHDQHGAHQHRAQPAVHLRLRLGHPRPSPR